MFLAFKNKTKPDYFFIGLIGLLIILGLIILSSASSDLGKIKFNDTYFYLKHQIIYGLIPGLIGFFLFSHFPYKKLKKIAFPFLIFNIFLLILVYTPLGVTLKGARRWLDVGFFVFQPSELLKLSFIIYLAAWLSANPIRREKFLVGFVPFLIICGIISVLILFQPATTVLVIIIAAGLIVYFLSGAKLRYIFLIFILGILILTAVIYSSPYRYQRVISYFHFSEDIALTSGYQRLQSLNSISLGGLLGVGFGNSTAKYKFLPEPIGDSIFAVIAEEFGFLGSLTIIILFLMLIIRGFIITQKTSDSFGKLLIAGFISIIGIQTFVHIATVSGLGPTTGIPLPFISYGGTSLAVFLTMAGIIVNISKR